MSSDPKWFYDPGFRNQMPHLKKVYDTDTIGSCNFAIIDYDDKWEILAASHQTVQFGPSEGLVNLPLDENELCVSRIVIIEDVCLEAARQLIESFNLSPEIFENHFSGAQFHRRFDDETLDYTNNDPDDWFTRPFKRDYISMKWMRPYRLDIKKFNSVTLCDRTILNGDVPQFAFSCNAWRAHIHFQAHGGTWSALYGSSSGLHGDSTIASEERVTLWTGQRHGIQYTIILVDSGVNGRCWPIEHPKIDTNELKGYEKRKRGRYSAASGSSTGRIFSDTEAAAPPISPSNISQAIMVGDRVRSPPDPHAHTASDTILPVHGQVYEHNSSSAAHLDTRENNHNAISPNPETAEASPTAVSSSLPISNSGHLATGNASAHVRSDATAGSENLNNHHAHGGNPDEGLDEYDNADCQRPMDTLGIQFPFFFRQRVGKVVQNLTRRAPCGDMSVREAYRSGLLRTPTSTLEDLCMWMYFYPKDDLIGHEFGPSICIYNIICQDIRDTLRRVDGFLDEITGLADDELILEHNIGLWRQMLWYWGKVLRELQIDLTKLTEFLWPKDEVRSAHVGNETADKTTTQILKLIANAERRLQTTFNLLATSISIVEARRGIVEAESVTHLTELAFVYIPLSFAASFFSMQVKELKPETTSIGGFFGLAVGVTLLSYSVRLVIRSENMISLRNNFTKAVRTEYDIPENRPIKSRYVARFIMKRLWQPVAARSMPIAMVFVLVLAPLIPMITIWVNSNLMGGIKVALTINYVVIGVFVLVFLTIYFKPRKHLRSTAEIEGRRLTFQTVL